MELFGAILAQGELRGGGISDPRTLALALPQMSCQLWARVGPACTTGRGLGTFVGSIVLRSRAVARLGSQSFRSQRASRVGHSYSANGLVRTHGVARALVLRNGEREWAILGQKS